MRYVVRITLAAAMLISALPVLTATAEPIGDPAFNRTWARTDRPVAEGRVNRTWMWGPEGHTEAFMELYAESPGGQRLVQYFDKTRMEINDPGADQNSIWYVTNGLLARELITGELQTGDASYETRGPANVQFAGDPHPDSPTYASFNAVLDYDPVPTDWTITQTINKAGQVGDDQGLAQYGVTAEHYVSDTDHTVASVFWDFMTSNGLVYEDGQYQQDQLFENPFFAVGFPITEAYWVNVPVGGEWKNVLSQCFERRCLTYTPSNPAGWQVEAGNIGQHYYEWRYESQPQQPSEPPQEPTDPPTDPPEPPVDDEPTGFGDGTYVVGEDIEPGLYVANNPSSSCYWERLSGFSGEIDDINANSFSGIRQVVEITGSDVGFTSERCGQWVEFSEPLRDDPGSPFGDGVYVVGDELAPGTWRSQGSGDSCYWARLDGFSGELADINANHFGDAGGIVEISAGDAGFESSRCGTWERIGN